MLEEVHAYKHTYIHYTTLHHTIYTTVHYIALRYSTLRTYTHSSHTSIRKHILKNTLARDELVMLPCSRRPQEPTKGCKSHKAGKWRMKPTSAPANWECRGCGCQAKKPIAKKQEAKKPRTQEAKNGKNKQNKKQKHHLKKYSSKEN